jgi:small redox-active disulfide protein 2
MLNIKVLGPGCANCQKVEEVAREAVANLGLDASIDHITNRADMAPYRLLATPGLVINEKLVCAGRIPTVQEVSAWLQAAMATA